MSDKSRSSQQATFVSLLNLKRCETAFHMYMFDKYSMKFESSEDKLDVRQRLFRIMQEIETRHSDNKNLSLRDKNNLVLNIMRDVLVSSSSSSSSSSRKHQPKSFVNESSDNLSFDTHHTTTNLIMNRETELYGKRTMLDLDERLIPTTTVISSDDKKHMMKSFELVSDKYNALVAPQPDSDTFAKTWVNGGDGVRDSSKDIDVLSMSADEFQRRVDHMMKDRMQIDGPQLPESNNNVHEMHETDSLTRVYDHTIPSSVAVETDVVCKMIALHGVNRDIDVWPYRYRFNVHASGYESTDLQSTYNNIRWIEAITVVLPMETNSASATRPFINEYDFSFPYISLNIDGYDGSYDGTNDSIRRCFSMMIFDRSYRAMNGRGYVVLRPVNREVYQRRRFATPLASLRDLSISLTKPNGNLINNSVDMLKISTINYESSNGLFIRVVTNKYFDKNEFFVGDTVIITNFDTSYILSSSQGDGDTKVSDTNLLDRFINREYGHEVARLGSPNEQGFYNTFYILAPGVLDNIEGTLILDEVILDIVRKMPGSLDYELQDQSRLGKIANMSMQVLVTLGVGCTTKM